LFSSFGNRLHFRAFIAVPLCFPIADAKLLLFSELCKYFFEKNSFLLQVMNQAPEIQ